jgi:Flp pilus assembly protein TadG
MRHDTPFLTRLRRDTRGNTIAMMAAAMVPLMGFAGSAIDMARLYVVKVRLQQACDAGVLAGRKAMTDTAPGTPLDNAAKTQAETFFNNNFQAGWYRTSAVSFVPAKAIDGNDSTAANAVSGTARVTVPMAVMGFFGMGPRELNVTCQARFDLADTDVMFVLDTTGSMACVPSAAATCGGATTTYTRGDGSIGYYAQEANGSKMEALRKAVILFDSTMRSSAEATTHFRYGFVTYSSSVNVGTALRSLPTNYLQNTAHTYQSRRLSPTNNGDYNYGNAENLTLTNVPKEYCVTQRIPETGFVRSGSAQGLNLWNDEGYYQARRYYDLTWTAPNGGTCKGKQQRLRALWRYEPISTSTGTFINTLGTSNRVLVPGRLDGLTAAWRGCIEEVNTTQSASFSVTNLPDDLDPDTKPTDPTNMWRPIWPEVEWLRDSMGALDRKDDEINEDIVNQYTDANYRPGGPLDRQGTAACGMPAQRLKVWTASEVTNYVRHVDFKPFGGTYHDVGMIWGTRMLSPDGVFGDDTNPWPGRNEPARSIVFMTDGTMSPNPTSYGQYGVETWDQRVAPAGSDVATLTARHTARFRVVCDAAKRKGITIYVVALGVSINNDLTYCASPGQTFQASSTQALEDAFKTIAQRVAMLRITT